MTMKKYFILLVWLYFGWNLVAQDRYISDQVKASVITCGNGDQLYSIFGHTALRIWDIATGLDVVYNYGTFDFDTANFYVKFVKGDLQYFVSTTTFGQFLYSYQQENRTVWEQELLLPAEKIKEMYYTIEATMHSDKKYYTYKFIDQNCTTMVMDVLNKAYRAPLLEKIGDNHPSYRGVINPFLENFYYEKLGINIIFGSRPDAKASRLFLPIELMESLEKTNHKDQPLIGKTYLHFKEHSEVLPKSIWNSFYTFGGFLLLIIALRKTFVGTAFLWISGLLGIFLVWVSFYSLHIELLWNYNALLFNPLYILWWWLGYKKKLKAFQNLFWILIGLLGIYFIYMLNKSHFWLIIPIFITQILVLLEHRKLSSC
jgi:hypothetical protein